MLGNRSMEKLVVPGFYRHFKGNIYRTLHVVKHTETGEDMVIYQAMYGKGDKWARPKSMFMDEGRFTYIPDKEAILLIPLELNPKYHFPDLDYVSEMKPLANTEVMSAPVKGLMTILINKKIVPGDFFDAYKKDDDIENAALQKIGEYVDGESLEEIFHLIQVWGGASGRGVYIFGDGFDWNKILPHYSALVHCCLSTKDTSKESIDKMVYAVCEFNKSVPHMGVAFITKHTRFWLCRTIGDDTFPIYDSIMADCVMRKNTVDHNHLTEYWTVMLAKAKQLGIGLKQLERQIFKYAYEHR